MLLGNYIFCVLPVFSCRNAWGLRKFIIQSQTIGTIALSVIHATDMHDDGQVCRARATGLATDPPPHFPISSSFQIPVSVAIKRLMQAGLASGRWLAESFREPDYRWKAGMVHQHLCHIVSRNRARNEIALYLIAAQRAQDCQLLHVFHAFGGHFHA